MQAYKAVFNDGERIVVDLDEGHSSVGAVKERLAKAAAEFHKVSTPATTTTTTTIISTRAIS